MMLLPASRPGAGRVSFDQLILHNVHRAPDAVAVHDAPDRPLWSDGSPRRLTWSQLDAATAAVAGRLGDVGLGADSIVAIQGPNSVDTLVAILGCQRANLVPALLHAGWRNAESALAIERVGAKAIFAATRSGTHRPADALRQVAADNFGVRFMLSFGADVPDGVISFEDCITDPRPASASRPPRLGNPAEHVAIVTWCCGPGGYVPVARSHNEWLSAGLLIVSALGLGPGSVLLSSLSQASFAGIATGLAPWLMSGATLVLHQAFDATVLGVQIQRHDVTHAVLPQVVLAAAARERVLDARSLAGLAGIVRRADLAPPDILTPRASEFAAFGEIGIVPLARRDGSYEIALGGAASGTAGAPEAIETGLTKDGTLALRGPMVPRAPFPGQDRGNPYPLEVGGWVATGFPARIEQGRLLVTGPRRAAAMVGGHALPLAMVDGVFADMPGATVAARAAAHRVLGARLELDAVGEDATPLSLGDLAAHAAAKEVSPLVTSQEIYKDNRRLTDSLATVA